MKLMSYTCAEWSIARARDWLENDVGVTLFKIVINSENENYLGGAPEKWVKILFYVLDPEQETMLKLKYPEGTFQNHMI